MQLEVKYFGISGLYAKGVGRLDLDSAVQYGTTIKDSIEDSEETITELVLDFAEISFISSYGLKVVLELYKIMQEQGVMRLTNVSEQVKNAFGLVGFDKFLDIQ